MKAELVDINETRRDLSIEVPTEVVDEAIGHAAAKLGKQARIPGFRPGKVPVTVIRQRFKPQIMQDVAEHLVSKAVGSAIVLDEIAKRDQITVTEDDLDAELQRYAEQTGHSVASIRARLQKDGELGRLAAGLRREKTIAHVLSKAQIKKG